VDLIDTNGISALRKKSRMNPGVIDFFERFSGGNEALYWPAVTVGELRRSVELLRYRGDADQALLMKNGLDQRLFDYSGKILEFDTLIAQVWRRLCVPSPQNLLDKQIAAAALMHDLIVVRPHTADFEGVGLEIINPFV